MASSPSRVEIYRLAVNQKITTAEAARLTYILREVRCSLEAVPPEPEVQSPTTINIVSVPPGHVYANGEFKQMPFVIEHEPIPALEPPSEPSPREMLEARLASLPDRELFALAGIDDDDTR